jgi:hypothetical protein
MLFIAFQARFLLSPDKEMAERGAVSGIEYHKDFDSYKKLLITKANNKHVKDIYKFYNKIVFSSVSKLANNQGNSDGDDDDAMELAFQGLDEDTDVDPGGDDTGLGANGPPHDVRGRARAGSFNEGDGSLHEDGVAAAMGSAGAQHQDGNVPVNRAAAAGSTRLRQGGESNSSASREEVAAAVTVGEGEAAAVAPAPMGRQTRHRQPAPSGGKSKTAAKGKGKAKATARATPTVQDPDEMMADEPELY